MAKEKRIGKKRVRGKMGQIQKRNEDGFAYNWHDVVEGAIGKAMEDN